MSTIQKRRETKLFCKIGIRSQGIVGRICLATILQYGECSQKLVL